MDSQLYREERIRTKYRGEGVENPITKFGNGESERVAERESGSFSKSFMGRILKVVRNGGNGGAG